MGWLGEPLPQDQQAHATPFAARCRKDAFEEALFARRRDLKALENVEVCHAEKRFLLRSELEGSCGAVLRAAGVAIPPTLQQLA